MIIYACPVCKHDDVEYEDKNSLAKLLSETNDVTETKVYYVSICSNCHNTYCYKVDIETTIKTKEKENETDRSNEGSEKPKDKG